MAALVGRPLAIHEQNSIAGLANKVLAGVADRVLTGFPGVLPKSSFTGNPVRDEIAAIPAPAERCTVGLDRSRCSWWAAVSALPR